MPRNAIRLADDLSLPAQEFIVSATAILGKRKSGKSGAVKVLAEEAVRLKLPFVLIDPVGVHWGIRSSYDGKGPGLDVLVIGGKHGDLELNRKKGAETARAVIESNVSVVIDLSEDSKAAFREFVKDFADELYHRNDSPRLVIIEEAPELVPQTIRPDQTATFDAVERLVRLGRNKAIGVVLVGQRPAKMSKDVLTQVDTLLIGRLLSPQDRKAIREWVEAWDVEDRLAEFEKALSSLPTRTLWLWSPEALGKFQPVKVRSFTTLHADLTHLRTMGLLAAKPVTTDVSSVIAKLGPIFKQAAEAKASGGEAGALRVQLAKANVEIERLRKEASRPVLKADVDPNTLVRMVESARKELDAKYRPVLAAYAKAQVKLRVLLQSAGAVVEALPPVSMAHAGFSVPSESRPARSMPPLRDAMVYVSPPRTEDRKPAEDGVPTNDRLYSGTLRILKGLASRYPLGLTEAQVATLTGFSARSSTFRTYMRILRRRGLVENANDGSIRVTKQGLDEAGEVPASPKTHSEVIELWRKNLYSGTFRLLQELVKVYPGSLDPPALAGASGFSETSSTFKTYTRILKRNGLITEQDRFFRASDALWPEQ